MVRELLARIPRMRLAVSATTRAQRPGEVNGLHYWFVTDEEFDRRLAAGDFIEYHVFPWGQRSGTLRSELARIGAEGGVPLLELETEGALLVKEEVAGAVTIFISAPVAELERRLRERATESTGEIEERIEIARMQLEQAGEFDYVIENDDLERAVDELTTLVRGLLSPAATMPRR